ncbi:MAG: hypothetical protein WCP39_06885 [Chlamydiota bacterium]
MNNAARLSKGSSDVLKDGFELLLLIAENVVAGKGKEAFESPTFSRTDNARFNKTYTATPLMTV